MRKRDMLDALFPKGRQKVLGALLVCPERRVYLNDLAQQLHVRPSSIQRELASLAEAGVVRRERDGNRVYYRIEPELPILPELRSIFLKTAGLADRIWATLEPVSDRIDVAFVFGSIARNERTAQSDADVMVIGSITLADLALPFRELERSLRTQVNVSIYSRDEFSAGYNGGNHFLQTIVNEPKIFLKGSQVELADIIGGPKDQATRDEQAGA